MVFLKDIVCILFDLLKKIFALAFLIPFIFILIICALISHLIDKYSYKEEKELHIDGFNEREKRRIARKNKRRHKYLDMFTDYISFIFT